MEVTAVPRDARRGHHKVTKEMEALMIDLRAKGETLAAIANTTGLNISTVLRHVRQPVAAARIGDVALTQALDKQALRERAKETLARRMEGMAAKASDLVEATIAERDPKGFMQAMNGLEKLDRVSGNTVGEGTRVIHEGLPQQPPQVELKVLIQQVLGAVGS